MKYVITLGILFAISWGLSVGLIKLITMCFSWPFSLPVATGIWLVAVLINVLFGSRKK